MEIDNRYFEGLAKLQSELLDNGWEAENSVSKKSDFVDKKAVLARFDNDFSRVTIFCFSNKKSLLVNISTNEDKQLPNIIMDGIKKNSSVLNIIMSNQSQISEDTYPDLLESLIPLCETVLLETDQGLIRASL